MTHDTHSLRHAGPAASAATSPKGVVSDQQDACLPRIALPVRGSTPVRLLSLTACVCGQPLPAPSLMRAPPNMLRP
eukprot:5219894-Alexandrium_andersonii.AAC.1